jgi:hypothetical protein
VKHHDRIDPLIVISFTFGNCFVSAVTTFLSVGCWSVSRGRKSSRSCDSRWIIYWPSCLYLSLLHLLELWWPGPQADLWIGDGITNFSVVDFHEKHHIKQVRYPSPSFATWMIYSWSAPEDKEAGTVVGPPKECSPELKVEKDNHVPFLGTEIQRTTDGSQGFTVYQTPTHRPSYLNFIPYTHHSNRQTTLYTMGLQPFHCKGAHLWLWAGWWATNGKIIISGVPNLLNYCIIFIV